MAPCAALCVVSLCLWSGPARAGAIFTTGNGLGYRLEIETADQSTQRDVIVGQNDVPIHHDLNAGGIHAHADLADSIVSTGSVAGGDESISMSMNSSDPQRSIGFANRTCLAGPNLTVQGLTSRTLANLYRSYEMIMVCHLKISGKTGGHIVYK
jgi:hypothetical protein